MPRWLLLVASVIIGYKLYPILLPDTFDTECLRGLRVLVTGASSGIGEQLAYHYARHGAHVYITARREDRLKQVVEKCKGLMPSGGTCQYYSGDMGVAEDREQYVSRAVAALGGVDQLILNHAALPQAKLWTGSRQDVQLLNKFLQVNLVAYADLTALTLPHLTKSHGAVGVVGSAVGRIPMAFSPEYSASKFGLDGFYGSLRQEWMAAKINVSLTFVTLGMIETEGATISIEALSDIVHYKENMLSSIAKFLVNFSSAEDAAATISEATTRHVADIIYPYNQMIGEMVILRHLCPGVLDWLVTLLAEINDLKY